MAELNEPSPERDTHVCAFARPILVDGAAECNCHEVLARERLCEPLPPEGYLVARPTMG